MQAGIILFPKGGMFAGLDAPDCPSLEGSRSLPMTSPALTDQWVNVLHVDHWTQQGQIAGIFPVTTHLGVWVDAKITPCLAE